MKMKRFISVALLICMLFTVVSCNSGASEAKKITEKLMTALETYDRNVIAGCVEDLPDNTGTAYVHDIYTEDYYVDLYSAANANLSYTISSASSKKVVLKVQMPDLYALYQKVFTSAMSNAMTNATLQEEILSDNFDAHLLVIALMIDDIEKNGISTSEQEITLTVEKYNDNYKIKTDDQLKLLLTDKLSLIQSTPTSTTGDVEE